MEPPCQSFQFLCDAPPRGLAPVQFIAVPKGVGGDLLLICTCTVVEDVEQLIYI
jgi:hypothetical protein